MRLCGILASIVIVFSCSLYAKSKNPSWLKTIELTPEEKKQVKQFKYVFVGGFLNEGLPFYFYDNYQTLTSLGVKEDHIHTIYPPSYYRILQGSDYVNEQILRIHNDEPQKIVIIGHSKGAVESLLFAIRHSQFTRDHIEAIFLIQGAFGGSPIADYVADQTDVHPNELMPWNERFALVLSRYAADHWLSPLVDSGLYSLLTSRTEHTLKIHYDLRPEAEANLKDKIFFITSSTHPSKSSTLLRICSYYLHTYFGPSDGLVLKKHQSLPWIGKTLTHEEVDHAALIASVPISNTSSEVRMYFMKHVLRFLAKD